MYVQTTMYLHVPCVLHLGQNTRRITSNLPTLIVAVDLVKFPKFYRYVTCRVAISPGCPARSVGDNNAVARPFKPSFSKLDNPKAL
jgi:hypothetical protein